MAKEAPEVQGESAESKESALDKANDKAKSTIDTAEKKAEELMKSDHPRKRAWGSQLKASLDAHKTLTDRVRNGKNKNIILARNLDTQFRGGLVLIEKMEKSLEPAKKKAKESEEKPAEKTKSPEELHMMIAKDMLKRNYEKAVRKLDDLIAEANKAKAKAYGRKLEYGELLHNPFDEYVDSSYQPNLVALRDSVQAVFDKPGSTVSDIQVSADKFSKLITKAKFKEAVRNDMVIRDLSLATLELGTKFSKKENERRIVRNIVSQGLRTQAHFRDARVGSTWTFETTDGVSLTLRKKGRIDYSAEITGLADRAIPRYAKVAKELGLKPKADEQLA